MPTPPAISATRGRRRAAAVKAPNGPSAITRVPGGIVPQASVKSPTPLTVIRSRRPSGAADSENGCASHQRSRVRKRQVKNCPARAPQPVEAHAADLDGHDARRLLDHARDPQAVAQAADERQRRAGSTTSAPSVAT